MSLSTFVTLTLSIFACMPDCMSSSINVSLHISFRVSKCLHFAQLLHSYPICHYTDVNLTCVMYFSPGSIAILLFPTG